MYDCFNVAMADLHAGDQRDDLDDVQLHGEPCPINPVYAAPEDGDILAMFTDLAETAERRWIMDKFFTLSDSSFETLEAFVLRAERDKATGRSETCRAVDVAFERFGRWLYTRNPHLTKADCWRAVREMGYQRGLKNWHRVDLGGNAERSAEAARVGWKRRAA